MEKYGFSAVLFVITGYANGDYGSIYAGWSTIETMAREGWIIQLHAGECGHAFLPDAPGSCTAGLDRSLITPTDFEYYIWPFGQTDAQYQARVIDDITAGEAAIQQHLNFPAGWQSTVFAAPFGAWGNGEDPWLISYWDSIFKTVFVQYISASDQAMAHAPQRAVPAGAGLRSPECGVPREPPQQRGVHAGRGRQRGNDRITS